MDTPEVRPNISPSLAVYRRIALTFIVLTALVVAAVAYVVLLRAEVVVLSKQDEVKTEFMADLAEQPTHNEIVGAIVEDEETLTQSFPSTSVVKVRVPSNGKVKITSTLSRSQTLIATTRLETDGGLLFRIAKAVTVPAFGSVMAEVYADDPAKPVPSGTLSFIIPGLNAESRKFFTVTSEGSMAGEEKDVRMVTASDMNAAETVLKDKLAAQLATRVREKSRAAGVAMDGEILSFVPTRRSSSVEVGADAERFELTVTVRAVAVYYGRTQLFELTKMKMKEGLSYDKSLRSIEDGTVKVDVAKLDTAKGTATLSVTGSGTAILSADAPSLAKDKILGVSAEAAKEYLEGVDGVASASVTVRPWFANRVPSVAEHVTIEVR